MLIFPAIDLYDGKAVRLYKGDYNNMTVYSSDPVSVAEDFVSKGARQIHMVDLAGARDGGMPNLGCARRGETGLLLSRRRDTRYGERRARLDAGVSRVILGTAAAAIPLLERGAKYGGKIAVARFARRRSP